MIGLLRSIDDVDATITIQIDRLPPDVHYIRLCRRVVETWLSARVGSNRAIGQGSIGELCDRLTDTDRGGTSRRWLIVGHP